MFRLLDPVSWDTGPSLPHNLRLRMTKVIKDIKQNKPTRKFETFVRINPQDYPKNYLTILTVYLTFHLWLAQLTPTTNFGNPTKSM